MGIPRTGARGALTVIVTTLAVCAGANDGAPAAAPAQTGSLTVVVKSDAAPRSPLRVTIDANICGPAVPDESVLTSNGRLANAVVSLPGLKGTHPASIEIANGTCRFVPHIAIAAPAASVRMVSRDQTLHTVHASHEGKSLFNVGLPMPGLTLTRQAPLQGVVELKCNTHPWMSGRLFVTDDRSVVSGGSGEARFDEIPAGTHAIAVWHEALGTATGHATIAAGQHAIVEITLR